MRRVIDDSLEYFFILCMRKKEKEMEKPYWEGKEYSYFSHKKCEYFPCHKNADPDDFNCLFCYCPLYALGDKCGGEFSIYREWDKGLHKLYAST